MLQQFLTATSSIEFLSTKLVKAREIFCWILDIHFVISLQFSTYKMMMQSRRLAGIARQMPSRRFASSSITVELGPDVFQTHSKFML
ncbi:MAG: hypothetical protein COY74_05590 [Nitrosopumilales archaeon CG_4_10_14_0_8_um_filter_34_8]|nr:MAG: hypothetical protein COY74_05590 [Nitrosopumilales archaeon CG_4_10_14_0_8_um_filter_34_8]